MKDFDLKQKEIVDKIRYQYDDVRSSHTFNNLYAWRKSWNIKLYLENTLYSAIIGDEKLNNWYFPIGDDKSKREFITSKMTKGKAVFLYMNDKDVEFLKINFPNKFIIERDVNHDEYVTRIGDHLAETGKVNRDLRRWWKRFNEKGPFDIREVSKENIHDISMVLNQWYVNHHCSDDEKEEMLTLEENVFFQAQASDFDKHIIYAGEIPFAVLAGYPINDDTYNLCIAKENGMFRYANYGIYRVAMELVSEKYTLFNLEDDLGDPGLRMMKRERLPSHMNEMYKAEMI